MKQSAPPAVRRTAAVGAAVALVAVSMMGVGATTAVADTADASTSVTTGTGTGTDQATPATTAPTPETATPTPITEATATDAPADTTPTASPSPTPAPAPAAAPAADAPADDAVTWPTPSSREKPIEFTTTAGEAFSQQFVAQGGDRALEYGFAPIGDWDQYEKEFRWDDSGLLRGTPTTPGVYEFSVLATDQRHTDTQWIRITVEPAAAVTLTTSVTSTADGFAPAWEVTEDAVRPWSHGDLGEAVSAIPAKPGQSLWLASTLLDRYGNPQDGPEMSSATELTSSAPGDVLSFDDVTNRWKATFSDVGRHELTVRAEGLSLSIPVDVADTPLAFTEKSSSDAPLDLTATSGTTFSHRFTVQGATGPVEYSLAGADGGAVIGDGDFFRSEFTIDPSTGVLAGTPRLATAYDFEVIARSGSETATAHVTLTVEPGAPVGVLASVYYGAEGPEWEVAPDGTVTEYTIDAAGSVQTKSVDSVPADQGIPLFVKAVAVDADGNRTTTPGSPHPVVTSDVATDRITWVTEAESSQVDFPHASIHTLTVSDGGVATSFRVDVRAHADGVGTSTTRPASGTLAYTGADETGPLAWALGLLAAGGGLLVHRLRRRRA
ncbi:cadherin repeat domain-containing protein [Curtobacterium sp. VKM Ac-2887]|uniref:cadherin repeat domain-containing protein n=1 Tax=Curtobacterium sp. VKM Ac-2887 TaxID=2783819 RepID=UPI00188B3514|nr:cadherin repeat domain-containing protein [Curtobacterium sp. VKM Ac-2887]MBF4587622.1 cadherin repeat domain-containing protein [Curtobacterium sp. VKM Ac-2887]